MERSLRIIATSLVLLCSALPSRAAETTQDAARAIEGVLCDGIADGIIRADETQIIRCRRLWQQRIEAATVQSQGYVERLIEESRLQRERAASLPAPPPPPVTVETFLGKGDLAYGDVVVTDKGPRVFVGKAGEPAAPEDFVALDSARSPHRGRAKSYEGAYPQPQRPQAAKPRTTAPSQQERKP